MALINIEEAYMERIERLDLPLEIKSKQARVNHLLAKAIEIQQDLQQRQNKKYHKKSR